MPSGSTPHVPLHRLGNRDEVPAIAAMGALEGRCGLGAGVLKFGTQRNDLLLEFEHSLHSREVETLLGEVLNAMQSLDVTLAVAAGTPAGASRIEQTLALVDAKGLGVHTCELGGNRDHEHRAATVATPSSLPTNRHGLHPQVPAW